MKYTAATILIIIIIIKCVLTTTTMHTQTTIGINFSDGKLFLVVFVESDVEEVDSVTQLG